MTATEAITKTLKKGSKKGLTAQIVAERTDLKINTVRFTLSALVKSGAAAVVGTIKAGAGRPANLYTLAA